MSIEYEATFANIAKDKIRQKLKNVGANLVKKEFLQKRSTWHTPEGCQTKKSWLRVRNEEDKITLTFKSIDDKLKITGQKEIELEVDDYKNAELFLQAIGAQKKSYQETKREIWQVDRVEIMIDEWPFLEPFIEIEGQSEEEVKMVSELLGFDYKKAIFGPVSILYSRKYKISEKFINNKVEEILFNGKNPFI